ELIFCGSVTVTGGVAAVGLLQDVAESAAVNATTIIRKRTDRLCNLGTLGYQASRQFFQRLARATESFVQSKGAVEFPFVFDRESAAIAARQNVAQHRRQ